MDLERHDFELDELIERIKGHDHRLVALQIPEGLKMQALEMMDEIEDETSAKVILDFSELSRIMRMSFENFDKYWNADFFSLLEI